MPKLYNTVPSKALKQPLPFTVAIPQTELCEFHTLLQLSRTPPPTYEGVREDGKFGVTHKWMTEAKEHWLHKFDWYGKIQNKREREIANTHLRRTWEKHITNFRTLFFP